MDKETNKKPIDQNNTSTDEIFGPLLSAHVSIPKQWRKFSRWVWLGIALFTSLLFLFGLPLRYGQLLSVPVDVAAAIEAAGITPEIRALWLLLVEILLVLSYTIVATIIFLQKAEEYGTYILSLGLFMFGTTIFSSLNAFAIAYPALAFLPLFARALSWILLLLMFYLFPDGRFVPGWTRWLAAAWIVWTLSWLLFPELPHNPTQPGGFSDGTQFLIYLAWFSTGIFSQIVRYRKYATKGERQQTKWGVYGFVIFFIGTFIEELPSVFDPTLVDHLTPESIWYQMISTAIFSFSVMALPIMLAFSIQHKRLWKIDFVINRSLVYATLTAFLGLIFFGLVLGVQQFSTFFTGDEQSLLAVVFSVAVITFLFQPTRLRLLRFVDRNLYGINLHYRKPFGRRPDAGLDRVQFELGQYRVYEPLGRGGMSEVYKGRHRDQDFEVAIKLLLPHMAAQKNFLARFEREARIMSTLEHPNIVRLYDFGNTDGIYFIVMELFAGGDLHRYLKSKGRLLMEDAVPVLREIAAALDYAHEKGVVHRDIKPSNVMLHEGDLQSALTDFGIMKLIAEESGLTQTGIVGTFDYISPEQIEALKVIDGRADVYALGIMTYQILTGEMPFDSTNPGQVLLAHMHQPPPDPRLLVPELPAGAALAIGRAMAKDREKRFATAGDFVAALST